MKKYSSKTLQIIAFVYLCFPVLYLIYTAVFFDIPMAQIGDVIFAPSFVICSILGAASGFGLWQVSRWAWYVFVTSTIFTLYVSAFICFTIGESHNPVLSYFASAVLPLALLYRVTREIRVPYFLPRIKWWESSTKYQISVPVKVIRKGGEVVSGNILDLSVAGCFIKVKDTLEQDERVSLVFDVFGQVLRCQGNAVWIAESAVTHPKGVGIKFSRMRKHMRRRIRIASKRMLGIAKLYRSSKSPGDREVLLENLEKIQFGFEENADSLKSDDHPI